MERGGEGGDGRARRWSVQRRAQPRNPSTLDTVTTVPPAGRASMPGRKACMVLMGPTRLTPMELRGSRGRGQPLCSHDGNRRTRASQGLYVWSRRRRRARGVGHAMGKQGDPSLSGAGAQARHASPRTHARTYRMTSASVSCSNGLPTSTAALLTSTVGVPNCVRARQPVLIAFVPQPRARQARAPCPTETRTEAGWLEHAPAPPPASSRAARPPAARRRT